MSVPLFNLSVTVASPLDLFC